MTPLAIAESGSGRGARRLSTHVLLPLLVCGLLLVGALTATATMLARAGARHELDARAATLQSLAQANLARSGRLGSAVAAARADGATVTLVPAHKPPP